MKGEMPGVPQSISCPNCGFAIPIGATWCEGCDAGFPGIPDAATKKDNNAAAWLWVGIGLIVLLGSILGIFFMAWNRE